MWIAALTVISVIVNICIWQSQEKAKFKGLVTVIITKTLETPIIP